MPRPRKLSDEQVAEIRSWHGARSILPTAGQMRKRYRISSSLMSEICRGIAYKRKRA